MFRVDSQTKQPVRLGGITGQVNSIVPVNGEIWLASQKGLGRVDFGSKIHRVDLDGALPFAARFLGAPIWLEGDIHPIVRYVDRETGTRDTIDSHQALPISVLSDPNWQQLRKKAMREENWRLSL